MRVVLDVCRVEGGAYHTADIYVGREIVSRIQRGTRECVMRAALKEIDQLYPGAEIELSGDYLGE